MSLSPNMHAAAVWLARQFVRVSKTANQPAITHSSVDQHEMLVSPNTHVAAVWLVRQFVHVSKVILLETGAPSLSLTHTLSLSLSLLFNLLLSVNRTNNPSEIGES